jgi:hypothetical protein
MIRINIRDSASPVLKDIAAQLPSRPLMAAMGKGLEKVLRNHFLWRERNTPNKYGWPRQHWWNREVARNTAFAGATADTASVNIASMPFRARLYGAVIRPVEKKALAIPMRAEAYGIEPGSGLIPNLFIWRSKNTLKAYLARREGTSVRLYYRLVKSATLKPDPQALPTDGGMMKGAVEAGQAYLARRNSLARSRR